MARRDRWTHRMSWAICPRRRRFGARSARIRNAGAPVFSTLFAAVKKKPSGRVENRQFPVHNTFAGSRVQSPHAGMPGVHCKGALLVMEEYEQLKKLVADAADDIDKAEGGNKTAGTRVRKQMQSIKEVAQRLRIKILESKSGAETP